MKMSKTIGIVAVCMTVIVLLALGGLYYVLMTPGGLRFAVRTAFQHFVRAENGTIGSIEGTLATNALLKNIELKNLPELPAGTTLRIQELSIAPRGINYKNAEVKVRNARLKFPVSDNIVVDGVMNKQDMAFTIFSPKVDVEELLSLIPKESALLKSLKGTVSNVDLHAGGRLAEPTVNGKFHVDSLTRPDLALTDGPGTLNLTLRRKWRLQLKGEVAVEKGSVQARKTKIELKPSRVYFSGDPKNPSLAVSAYSRIETLDITIAVGGTAEKPDLRLTSDPPLSREELMVTLATGRKWEGFENLEQGQVSSALVKELASYLFFSGSGEGFFEKMGISDVKVTLEGNKQGVGFKKEVSKNLDVGYEIEQKGTPASAGKPDVAQTVGADYRVTDAFFATVERETQSLSGPNSGDSGTVDDRLMMKYKTRF